ncbi:thermonuclease family protein [Pseudomonas protegens]|uniref:thermonuclease family protein n=1 Tax=Pseudomonas protegens TaxID=380021 RepID=UPI0023EA7A6D|nr:thermonuclease family protein [Pseudomonas protegens]MDF4211138.1 thermonuclease family protein [Pseudomonas protegens]
MKQSIALLAVFFCIGTVNADTSFRGDVVRILDGDTIEVLDANRQTHRVRLANIDAPERRQAFGEASRQTLADMSFRQKIEVIDKGSDQYGRRIGVLMLNGRDLNAEMISKGMAWVYTRYNSNPNLPALQQQARKAKLGLWVEPSPTPPWEFRHAR